MRKSTNLLALAFTLATCVDKLLSYFWHYLYLTPGPH